MVVAGTLSGDNGKMHDSELIVAQISRLRMTSYLTKPQKIVRKMVKFLTFRHLIPTNKLRRPRKMNLMKNMTSISRWRMKEKKYLKQLVKAEIASTLTYLVSSNYLKKKTLMCPKTRVPSPWQ